MAFFVISGKTNCSNCTYALHVASHLSKHLPNFKYKAIVKDENEWMTWLDQLNSTNNWHHIKSPIVWKEITRMGGKPYLIGGLGEFWEYCYDYYGFTSRMTKSDLALIMADNDLLKSSKSSDIKCRNITISGTTFHQVLHLLIYEVENCFEGEDVQVKIFDRNLGDDNDDDDYFTDIIEEFRDILKKPFSVSLVSTTEAAFTDCDLLIISDDYSRLPSENSDAWLKRCKTEMVIYAEELNMYAKRTLRVVLNHLGPVCFTASVLMEFCTIVRPSHIVAVTADEGISTISMLADKAGELVENCWCPPVWGFCGLLSYVAITATPIQATVYRPFKRSLTMKENSHLSKGEKQFEIRFLEHLLKVDDELYEEVKEKQENEKRVLNRAPVLAKVRALVTLLKLWFAKTVGDEIISLGICSNGAFGFPVGICFSQLVILNEKREWQPLSKLLLYSRTYHKISEISLQVENTFKRFELGDHYSSTPVKTFYV